MAKDKDEGIPYNITYVKSLQEQRALRCKGYEDYLHTPNKEELVDDVDV